MEAIFVYLRSPTLPFSTSGMAFLSYFLWYLKFFSLLHIKSALLIAFNNAFNVYNPHSIWSHFSEMFAVTKHTLKLKQLEPSKTCYWFQQLEHQFFIKKNQEFGNRMFDWVWLPILFCVSTIWFDCRTQSNSIHGSGSIGFVWVRLKFSSIGFDLLHRVANHLRVNQSECTKNTIHLCGLY